MNLIEGIQKEIERVKVVLTYYEEIPQGVFGATMIKQTIKRADAAIASGDVVEMLSVLQELKDIQ